MTVKLSTTCLRGHRLILAIEQHSRSGLIQFDCPMCGGRVEAAIPPARRESIFRERRDVDDVRLDRRDSLAYERGLVP